MKRIVEWTGLIAALALSVSAIAYAATPGYHRALTPGLYGLSKVADNLHIDDPARTAEVQGLIAEAEAQTLAFFGALQADPIYIVCTDEPCRRDMGLGPVGLSVAGRWILIAPRGVNATILTHERVHAEVHGMMGVRDIFDQRFPAWFDEGLAGHLSADTRYLRPDDPREADWIKAAHSFRDWGRLHPGHDWRVTYGAAAALVAEKEAQIGRDGLLDLIHRVAAGEDFGSVWAEEM